MKHSKAFIITAGCLIITGVAAYLKATPDGNIPRDLRDAPISSEALEQLGDTARIKTGNLPTPIATDTNSGLLIPADILARAAALNNGKEPASLEKTLTLLYEAGDIVQDDVSIREGKGQLNKLNPRLLEFFTANYKPGAIVIIGAKDALGMLFRTGQMKLTADGRPSRWSHCFVFGDLKTVPEEEWGKPDKSPYIYESDLHMSFKDHRIHLNNGIQENWIGKWSTNKIEYAAIIDLGLTEEQKGIVFRTALESIAAHIRYSLRDNLGVLLAMIEGRQDKPNPFHGSHTAMFCSAFVRYCYEKAARDFFGPEISMFNTTPEDIARMGIKTGKIIYYQP
ncbi:MAG: hypothetical protein A2X34_09300 [Elusimicrobia bacterium GWC2_51_8]|nr:MAG: hypothetical protein A2X33_01140 [Elusimicrobia bacterium GWA2_51_34]OGR60299.1 MAG: hypothetical protein A2X34_09300 [Elusimicrobia bacterium GWC2_51_8]OGR85879.1 MAG: hypothetical protein A2021_03305 [Elusimicrobia bacterium GWF2_52_66]HAF96132.1 hypothetical protein [Elusimicrobiota bacterium]HCE97742.1 hypothetical protein [Elusimicrobiota bacterium]